MSDPNLEAEAVRLAQIHSARIRQRWNGRRDTALDVDDLCGAAHLGAAKALARFDPERGVKFSSFCIAYMRGEEKEEMRRSDNLSRRDRDRANALHAAGEELPALWQPPLSLDATSFHNGEFEIDPLTVEESLVDRASGPEEDALTAFDAETLDRIVGWLPDATWRHVVRRYYYDGWTFKRIGCEIDRSESRVHQIHAAALRLLRRYAEGLIECPPECVARGNVRGEVAV